MQEVSWCNTVLAMFGGANKRCLENWELRHPVSCIRVKRVQHDGSWKLNFRQLIWFIVCAHWRLLAWNRFELQATSTFLAAHLNCELETLIQGWRRIWTWQIFEQLQKLIRTSLFRLVRGFWRFGFCSEHNLDCFMVISGHCRRRAAFLFVQTCSRVQPQRLAAVIKSHGTRFQPLR